MLYIDFSIHKHKKIRCHLRGDDLCRDDWLPVRSVQGRAVLGDELSWAGLFNSVPVSCVFGQEVVDHVARSMVVG
jgi:hypothetical protein